MTLEEWDGWSDEIWDGWLEVAIDGAGDEVEPIIDSVPSYLVYFLRNIPHVSWFLKPAKKKKVKKALPTFDEANDDLMNLLI